jgi:hypothetical protein
MEERSARRIIRRLEGKSPPVIIARTSKAGGRQQQTVGYEFNTSTEDSGVPREEEDGGLYTQGRGTAHAGTEDPPVPQKIDRKKKKKEEAVASTAVVPKERMDKDLQVVWNYYLEATGREEVLSPAKKKMGLAIIRELYENRCRSVINMAAAIDMACHIAKRNPKTKAYLSNWTSIFSKWNTFASLHQEYQETSEVGEAAQLPVEYWPPPPPKVEPTPQEIARKQEEQRRNEEFKAQMRALGI